MPKLIDAEKLLWWIKDAMNELPYFCETPDDIAKYRILKQIRNLTDAGTFDPTPVQPDIHPGDMVRGKKKALYHGAGIGRVRCIFWDAEGHWADLMYDNGSMAIYPLDELEVIANDQPTEKA
ncbi:hypothetical protein A3842_11130 [Paenibacillus sp. P3E]|uniref:hypothetical protein n=1 Tax=Paenibacillus sp. P3E TaxID=1349435 RepID=UPI00093D1D65|nr:hypothetical protein [Paenibacillus sp. P3E]OKP81624.1 hypothetical protein A3842_11130 [Paenibacillus sp. P3E]